MAYSKSSRGKFIRYSGVKIITMNKNCFEEWSTCQSLPKVPTGSLDSVPWSAAIVVKLACNWNPKEAVETHYR